MVGRYASGDAARSAVCGNAARAASAIAAVFKAYRQPSVRFYKTLDTLLIELGSPFGLRLYHPATPAQHFDTTTAIAVNISNEVVDILGQLCLQVVRPHRLDEDSKDSAAAMAQAAAFITEVFAQLARDENESGVGGLGDKLRTGLTDAMNITAPAPFSQTVPPGFKPPYLPSLDNFFRLLDDFFSTKDFSFDTRMLVVFRNTNCAGPSEIRPHILGSQLRLLDHVVRQKGSMLGISDSSLLKSSLISAMDPAHWTIADSFRTGVTCWMYWPWCQTPATGDLAVAEKLMAVVGGGGEKALVVPVHISGLPWLALVGIFPPDNMGLAHAFYREYLPILVTKIRALAEQAYLDEVWSIAAAVFRLKDPTFARLTEALSLLTGLFPFLRVSVSENGVIMETAGVGSSRIKHQLLDKARIEKVIKDARAQVLQEQRGRLSSYVDIGHTLKNLVSSTGWAEAAQRTAQVYCNFDRKLAHDRDKALEDIRTALSYADNALSLFQTVEGLGHFTQLIGAFNGEVPWAKFADWIESDVTGSERDVLAIYGDSIGKFAGMLCHGWRLDAFTITVAQETRIINANTIDNLSMDLLHFPPFKQRQNGIYIFIFCLLEPVLNAIRAVLALPATCRYYRSPAALRLTVEQDGDVIRIVVTNISTRNLPETLSGLESTKKMMREIRLAAFNDRPEIVTLDDHLYEISSEIRLHPRRLANFILHQGDERRK